MLYLPQQGISVNDLLTLLKGCLYFSFT